MERKRRKGQCRCADRAIRAAMCGLPQWAGPFSLEVDQVAASLGVREEDIRAFALVGLLDVKDASRVSAASLLGFLDEHGETFALARLEAQMARLTVLMGSVR